MTALGTSAFPEWDRGRLFDKDVMHLFLTQIKAASTAKCTSVVAKEKAKPRPQALNTVELLRVCSSALGISPHHTMQVAERLYTQGYISYPRTETTNYPENFDLRSPLKAQQGNSIWGSYVRDLLSSGTVLSAVG